MGRGIFSVICGFLPCFGFALFLIRLAPRLGLLDIPRGRRQHLHPVPMVGGLALILSLALGHFEPFCQLPLAVPEQLAVLAMALLGLLDDRFELRARWKALVSLGLALLLAYSTSRQLAHLTHPLYFLGLSLAPTSWAVLPMLVAMYWALPQSFNLIDGANGLAMGFGLVVLASLWAAGYPHAFFVGALLGCLTLNWPRARLFLGDCGSLSLGLLLTILVKGACLEQHPSHIILLFAYPTADVSMVVLVRLLQGRSLGIGDRNHLHHQIKDRWPGLKMWIAPLLLSLAALCASGGYLGGDWLYVPVIGVVLLALVAASLGVTRLFEGRSLSGMLGREAESDDLRQEAVSGMK